MMRRLTTLVGTTTAVVLFSATGAMAHECYNASRSANGNAHAVNGQHSSYGELLDVLCPAGDAIVEAAVAEHGFDSDGILVNTKALMGAGKHETDGHAIDYLPDWLSAAIGAAFGTCFG
ncbi:hypothetical protein [Nocardioides speluncae]|uniref:hypothetical protein n=1 Tax=Nocardioides speluncae TaxID=2670337 RepID=UPI0012B16564|nr:hypothetical protein [Nocardioides speluncae]